MSLSLISLVLLSALIHASWNGLMKGVKADKLHVMVVMCIIGGIICLPFITYFGFPDQAALPYLLISGMLHVAYYLLVGLCYRHADFSSVYPLFRGGAPLITVIISAFYLGEWLSLPAFIGILTLVAGLLIFTKSLNKKAFIYAIILAGVVALYTISDALGARLGGSSWRYLFATHLVNALMIIPILPFIKPKVTGEMAVKCTIAGVLSVIGYGLVLYVMTLAPIGMVSALRETSVLFAALIGVFFLKEKLNAIHGVAAFFIVIGLVIIKAN